MIVIENRNLKDHAVKWINALINADFLLDHIIGTEYGCSGDSDGVMGKQDQKGDFSSVWYLRIKDQVSIYRQYSYGFHFLQLFVNSLLSAIIPSLNNLLRNNINLLSYSLIVWSSGHLDQTSRQSVE